MGEALKRLMLCAFSDAAQRLNGLRAPYGTLTAPDRTNNGGLQKRIRKPILRKLTRAASIDHNDYLREFYRLAVASSRDHLSAAVQYVNRRVDPFS